MTVQDFQNKYYVKIEHDQPCVCCGTIGTTIDRWELSCALYEARRDVRGKSCEAQQWAEIDSYESEQWFADARQWYIDLLDIAVQLRGGS